MHSHASKYNIKQGRNQDFAKGGGLKMEKFCDIILMTCIRWRNL